MLSAVFYVDRGRKNEIKLSDGAGDGERVKKGVQDSKSSPREVRKVARRDKSMGKRETY